MILREAIEGLLKHRRWWQVAEEYVTRNQIPQLSKYKIKERKHIVNEFRLHTKNSDASSSQNSRWQIVVNDYNSNDRNAVVERFLLFSHIQRNNFVAQKL